MNLLGVRGSHFHFVEDIILRVTEVLKRHRSHRHLRDLVCVVGVGALEKLPFVGPGGFSSIFKSLPKVGADAQANKDLTSAKVFGAQ